MKWLSSQDITNLDQTKTQVRLHEHVKHTKKLTNTNWQDKLKISVD